MKLPKLLIGSLLGQCIIAGLLVITFLKGAEHLEAEQNDVARYQDIKAKVAIDIKQTVIDYLNTGDAAILAKAEKQLEILENSLRLIDNDMTASVIYQITLLRLDLTQKYRAAGKLGSNAQIVLQNAERELASNIKLLSEYADEGASINPIAAHEYYAVSAEMAQSAHVLSLLRNQYLASGDEKTKTSILFQLEQLKQQVLKLEQLPRLGLMESSADEDDDFFGRSDEVSASDQIEGIIADLTSLTRRYPKEIEYTQARLQETQVLKEELLTRTNQVALNVKSIEHSLFGVNSNAFVNIQYTLYALIAASVLMALIHSLGQHHWFHKPLRRFQQALQVQAERGNTSNINEQDFKGDFHRVVGDYNRLVEISKDKLARIKRLYQAT